MRELVVRAHLHGARLGDPGALASARRLGADIDNPDLARLLTGATPVSVPAVSGSRPVPARRAQVGMHAAVRDAVSHGRPAAD
jgi:hypothetical protein